MNEVDEIILMQAISISGLDEIDLSEITDKCYGCDADKLKENENYIRKDFE